MFFVCVVDVLYFMFLTCGSWYFSWSWPCGCVLVYTGDFSKPKKLNFVFRDKTCVIPRNGFKAIDGI